MTNMSIISKEQEEDAIRAFLAVINAWESDTVYTGDEMCEHLDEIYKVVYGLSSYYDFLKATAFNKNKQLWIN